MEEVNFEKAHRFIEGIEAGQLSSHECLLLIEHFDPLFTHFLLRYLRAKYPTNIGKTEGAGNRLLEFLREYPMIANLATPPKNESLIEWFEDSYMIQDFFKEPRSYINLIVDKLEG